MNILKFILHLLDLIYLTISILLSIVQYFIKNFSKSINNRG
uniref:Uncharacterized protein n=1 Tax=Bostrychia simpliciuscula TaxID=324754 RepID=A0A1Z1M857_9FLOR|nr:hypothetical protein [Bostrychia simpliciuscula]ARW62186.1 hypothetical protein [Bostrychia simpliciuscula]